MENIKLFGFFNFGTLTNFKFMESKQVDGIFEIFLNESEIAFEEITNEGRFNKFLRLPNSQSNNDETLHLIMKKLHNQRIVGNLMGKKCYVRHFIVLMMVQKWM
jgi:hypothetical protein